MGVHTDMGRGTLWVAPILVFVCGAWAGDGGSDPIAELAKLVDQHNNNNRRHVLNVEQNPRPWRERTVVEVKKNVNEKISKIVIRRTVANSTDSNGENVKKSKPYARQLVDTTSFDRSDALRIPLSTILLSKVPMNKNWKIEAKKIFVKEDTSRNNKPIRIKMSKNKKSNSESKVVKDEIKKPIIMTKKYKNEQRNSPKIKSQYKDIL